jgi:uncharacterized protein YwgA
MKITKRQLRRIIKEEVRRLRVISEAEAQPSLEAIEKMIKQKKENIESLEGYRMMDPDIDDAIKKEIAAKSDLIALYRKLSGGK